MSPYIEKQPYVHKEITCHMSDGNGPLDKSNVRLVIFTEKGCKFRNPGVSKDYLGFPNREVGGMVEAVVS